MTILVGQTVTVAYTPGNVTDSSGTVVGSFGAQATTNGSVQIPPQAPIRAIPLIEIAFDSNPGDAAPIWTDVTKYAQSFSTKRGRQVELDQFAAGTADVVFNNGDRRFDPVYAASPYYPNVNVGKRVRISAAWDDVTYRIFDGYVEAWPQTWLNVNAATVQMRATDAFKRFSLYPLNGDYSGNIRGDAPWGFWQFSGGLDDSSAHGNTGTWIGSNPTAFGGTPFALGTSGLSSKFFGTDDEMTHGISGWVIGSGFTLEAWVYNAGWAGNDASAHGIWVSATPWGNQANGITVMKWYDNLLYFRIVSPNGVLQDVVVNVASWVPNTWRHLACTAHPTDGMKIYIDGVLVAGPTNVGTFALPTLAPTAPRWGRGHDIFANSTYLAQAALYSTALRADQIVARYKSFRLYFPVQTTAARLNAVLDVAGWPVGDRRIDGGAATLAMDNPAESLLSYAQRINLSEVGRLFMSTDGKVRFIGRDAGFSPPYTDSQATFGDDASELPYANVTLSYDDTRVWNEVRLQREGGDVQVVRDPALQTSDIVREFPDSTQLLHSNDNQTLAAAQYRLSQYKQAVVRVDDLLLKPLRDPVRLWPQVLGREIGERVVVVRRPQQAGSFSQQVYIEGVQHTVDAGSGSWDTQFTLSLADVTVFWLLGDSTRGILGSTTVLSF